MAHHVLILNFSCRHFAGAFSNNFCDSSQAQKSYRHLKYRFAGNRGVPTTVILGTARRPTLFGPPVAFTRRNLESARLKDICARGVKSKQWLLTIHLAVPQKILFHF
jgi:hypothetical protein